MVKNTFTLILFVILFSGITFGQKNSVSSKIDTSIDSIYLKSVAVFETRIYEIRDKVWPEMEIGPFCIFRLNGPGFLVNHPDLCKPTNPGNGICIISASDYHLMGATQSVINGVLTAHNDYTYKPFGSFNQYYAEIFHELHHVYQRNHVKDLKFDNPADLLTYPENFRNDAVKQYENELWLNLLLDTEKINVSENINKIFTCRKLRSEIIGLKYINYEKAVESIEGPATFCEYEFMNEYTSDVTDNQYINYRFRYLLSEPVYGRERLRSKHLLTGMVQCELLSRYFNGWQSEYYSSGMYLYDYFVSKFNPVSVELPDFGFYLSNAKFFTQVAKEKHIKNLNDFNNQSGIKLTLLFSETPEFRGFDPMHAEAVNDSLVIHYTMLRLGKNQNQIHLTNHRALSAINNQIWFIKKVTLFIPEIDINLNKDRLIYSSESIDIDWEIIKILKTGKSHHSLNSQNSLNEITVLLE